MRFCNNNSDLLCIVLQVAFAHIHFKIFFVGYQSQPFFLTFLNRTWSLFSREGFLHSGKFRNNYFKIWKWVLISFYSFIGLISITLKISLYCQQLFICWVNILVLRVFSWFFPLTPACQALSFGSSNSNG